MSHIETLNTKTKYQQIDGFGFSEAFQRAYNIYNLTEPKRSALVDLLFNTTAGAGFSILRNGVGSSVNGSKDWMVSIAPFAPSPEGSREVGYVWDGKDSGQLWLSQQAVKYGVKTFYGNAWSAPGFMKTNGNDAGGGLLCGVSGTNCSTGDWRQAYADYLVKYIQLYAENGVGVTHIGFVNEPDYSANYASMLSTGQQSADFIRVLHPTLARANLSHVQITCCEATGWKTQANMTRDLVKAGVEDLIGVITSHPYTSDITEPQPTSLKVWETEYSDLSGSWSTAWFSGPGVSGDGFTWANHIHTGLTAGNVSGYLWWVATQDRETNRNNNEKLILVDQGEYYVSKRFWAFAQYSRPIRPGAVRVGVSVADAQLKTTAFVNADGSVVVVILNSGAAAESVTVAGVRAAAARAWVTDGNNDMASAVSAVEVDPVDGSVVVASVPGRGLVSLVITPVAAP
ncbi:glycoside hydrolase superfamily [Echria macrotheca]|uniref:Glycoside hydrolase superfamily n=1 Tax=Echria macrotheca TaxID=438768 RepID=A0AAJ0BMV8_9PEZI|nr:glycoside hydrolase superfamily [Echria macrotheca]